jgi:hypothetical protein
MQDRLLTKPIAFLGIGRSPAPLPGTVPETLDAKADSKDDKKAPVFARGARRSKVLGRTIDAIGATKAPWFGGKLAPGSLAINALRERGQDPIRLAQGPFIKPKKQPKWLKVGFAARPKLGIAVANASAEA